MKNIITENNENHILVEAPDDAVAFKSSGLGFLCYKTSKNWSQWCVLDYHNDVPYIGFEILGLFNKSGSKIDFEVNEEWVSKTPPLTKDMFVGYNDYTEETLYCDTPSESYISLLDVETKHSSHNIFIILKQI